MTREEAREALSVLKIYDAQWLREAVDMAIKALSTDAVQGCDGCRYNTRIPQERCLRCKRCWKDNYERKGGDSE